MGAKEFLGTKAGVPYLNNHLRFFIKYHKDEAFEGARIVGFEVDASTAPTPPAPTPPPTRPMTQRQRVCFQDLVALR